MPLFFTLPQRLDPDYRGTRIAPIQAGIAYIGAGGGCCSLDVYGSALMAFTRPSVSVSMKSSGLSKVVTWLSSMVVPWMA